MRLNYIILVLAMIFSLTGCKKNNDRKLNAVYTYTVNTLSVVLDNLSDGGVSYHWDFGDGSEASTKNPTHRYTSQGSYTITLTVTGEDGNKDVFSDVIVIAGPTINIDGNFNEWDDIPFNNETTSIGDGILVNIKSYPSNEKINFLIYGTADLNKTAIIEAFINADKNSATGWNAGWFMNGGSGIELTLSGSYLGKSTSIGAYKHTASGQDWGNTEMPGKQNETKFSDIGSYKDGKAFEFSISKALLKASVPSGSLSTGITLNITVYNSGWGVLGSLPIQSSSKSQISVKL